MATFSFLLDPLYWVCVIVGTLLGCVLGILLKSLFYWIGTRF